MAWFLSCGFHSIVLFVVPLSVILHIAALHKLPVFSRTGGDQ